ncbi:MAG: ABC transporter ATP-binding protein/permease, partial [Actinobacteria bacterium]|nr:ABC transporter ATP-binding protein/permease [Actinomycetota bacterium]
LEPVGIAHLEDPAMLDRVSLARAVGAGEVSPGDATRGFFGLMNEMTQWVVAGIIIGRYWWWLAVVMFAVYLGTRFVLRREIKNVFDRMIGNTRDLRRSRYFRDLVLQPAAAKETRVFGMRAWILDRFGMHWLAGMREVWERRRKSRIPFTLVTLALGAVTFGAYFIVARAGAQHRVSIAVVTALSGAILEFGSFNIESDLLMTQGAASIPEALELERALAQPPAPADVIDPAGTPRRAIRFEGLTFRYPGNPAPVFDGLDLEIPAGRSLAIVGPNGAGKTTLVKVLARLYEAQAGRITVDDVPLADIDARAWQRRLGAIFQDFVQYHLPASENVGFGAIERLDDREALARAAQRAGATSIIDELPNGWSTILSRQYGGGADISGGEWQRIALARALFAVDAGAGVLILDEPTANLDVRAEVELFDRFLELTKGLTTILISHRFSTVRRADRIVVLEHGKVSEQGTHDVLLALGGTYAHMFRLQAARFTDEPEVVA